MIKVSKAMEGVKPRIICVIPCYNIVPHVAEVVTYSRKYIKENQ